MFDLEDLRRAVAAQGRVVRVVLAERRGSAPREAGAAMLIWEGGHSGTIGGGRLELEAIAEARCMLQDGPLARLSRKALGPALNQCCGGAVTLISEIYDAARCDDVAASPWPGVWARPVEAGAGALPDPLERRIARRAKGAPMPLALGGGWLIEPIWRSTLPVYIYGAGHVGRALAKVLSPLPQFAVTLIDQRPDAFDDLPDNVKTCLTTAPGDVMSQAPAETAHFVMTPAHDLDLELCHRLLQCEFGFAGLIGSATKWARFRKRLAGLGHDAAQIARITCPIGSPDLGRAPQAIAIGVAAQLLRLEQGEGLDGSDPRDGYGAEHHGADQDLPGGRGE